MQTQLGAFLEQLKSTKSEKACGILLLDFSHQLGWEGCNIWFGDNGSPTGSTNSTATSYSKGLLEAFNTPAIIEKWRVPKLVEQFCGLVKMSSDGLVRWGGNEGHYRFGKQSVDYTVTGIGYSEMQVENYIILPIPTMGNGGPSGVSFCSKLTQEKCDTLFEANSHLISVASSAAHLRMQAFRRKACSPNIHLTSRERECMLWLASGYRNAQISWKLGIGEVTVEMHIKNARKKLDAATREQAIAKAILMKLITP